MSVDSDSKEVKEFKSCAAEIDEWPNCSHRDCHVLYYQFQVLNHDRYGDSCGASCDVCAFRDCPYRCALHFNRLGCPECIVDRLGFYVGDEPRRFINNYGDDVPDLVESFEAMPLVQNRLQDEMIPPLENELEERKEISVERKEDFKEERKEEKT